MTHSLLAYIYISVPNKTVLFYLSHILTAKEEGKHTHTKKILVEKKDELLCSFQTSSELTNFLGKWTIEWNITAVFDNMSS